MRLLYAGFGVLFFVFAAALLFLIPENQIG
jgi:hypothetical protein